MSVAGLVLSPARRTKYLFSLQQMWQKTSAIPNRGARRLVSCVSATWHEQGGSIIHADITGE